MSYQAEIRARVTARIVEALQKGSAPWRKPWSALENAGFPTNVVSKKRYSGVNPLLLQLVASERCFRSQYWGTYRQWQALGGQVTRRPNDVPPGQWGTKVIFWSPVTKVRKKDDGTEEEIEFPILREYTVFNADQVEGEAIDPYRVRLPNKTTPVGYGPAERVIAATGADIRHVPGDTVAYFRPPLDYIVLPLKAQFEDGPGGLPGYYATACHELAHWSEHRLGWTGSYALGELRAEIAACYLTAEIGIPHAGATQNHALYLAYWIKALKEDHSIIFKIAAAASKASDFILSFSREHQPEEEVLTA
jgi:antirestriction protein ArdC